ncbi:hypothetical protein JKP88DRAFT_245974 [Tribonema minus]|uniref:Uncharacterized protein n=1 Tax=Tribonema minus TaxID=303371 RepID=A0A835YVP4_9STRA|nr:hypothetical protein JKP88DRAFT_245974 [Tribonema minus]
MHTVLALLWAFLLNAASSVALDVSGLAARHALDFSLYVSLVRAFATFYVVYGTFRVFARFGSNIGLIAWESLDDFPHACRTPLLYLTSEYPKARHTLKLVLVVGLLQYFQILLHRFPDWRTELAGAPQNSEPSGEETQSGSLPLHTEPLPHTSASLNAAHATAAVQCNGKPGSVTAVSDGNAGHSSTLIGIQQRPEGAQGAAMHAPMEGEGRKGLKGGGKGVRLWVRLALHFGLMACMSVTAVWALQWVLVAIGGATPSWLRMILGPLERDFGLWVVVAWTVWLLVLALILCGNASSPSPAIFQLREVFQNLKASFVLSCCLFFTTTLLHPSMGFLDAQRELTVLTVVIPITYVVLYQVVDAAMRWTSWVGLALASIAAAVLSIVLCSYSNFGGPGTVAIMGLHIFGKLKRPPRHLPHTRDKSLCVCGRACPCGLSWHDHLSPPGQLMTMGPSSSINRAIRSLTPAEHTWNCKWKKRPGCMLQLKAQPPTHWETGCCGRSGANAAIPAMMPSGKDSGIGRKASKSDVSSGSAGQAKAGWVVDMWTDSNAQFMYHGLVRLSLALLVLLFLFLAACQMLSLIQEQRGWYPSLIRMDTTEGQQLVVDHALIAKVSLRTTGKATVTQPRYATCGMLVLDKFFPPDKAHGWGVGSNESPFRIIVPPPEYRQATHAQFVEAMELPVESLFINVPFACDHAACSSQVRSRKGNVSIVAVRGTDIGRLGDFIEDIKIWVEPVVFMLLSTLFPTIRIWPDSTASAVIEWLHETLQLFGLQSSTALQYYFMCVSSGVNAVETSSHEGMKQAAARSTARISHYAAHTFCTEMVLHNNAIFQVTLCELIDHCGDNRGRFTGCEWEYNLGNLVPFFLDTLRARMSTWLAPGIALVLIIVALLIVPEGI